MKFMILHYNSLIFLEKQTKLITITRETKGLFDNLTFMSEIALRKALLQNHGGPNVLHEERRKILSEDPIDIVSYFNSGNLFITKDYVDDIDRMKTTCTYEPKIAMCLSLIFKPENKNNDRDDIVMYDSARIWVKCLIEGEKRPKFVYFQSIKKIESQ